MNQGADLVKGKEEGKFDHKHKTDVTYSGIDEHELKMTLSNKDAEGQWTYSPAAFCKDGKEVVIESSYKRIPPNGKYEGKVEVKCGAHDLGPLKGWGEVGY